MNFPRRSNLEPGLYALAFILAFGLRFMQLGTLPLSDVEASWALQSLDVVRGLKPILGPQPGYILLTSTLFFLMESSNLLARFWPALLGSLLTLTPLAFRKRIGNLTALVMAFGLAIDPGLVGLSRQAGSLILPLGAGMLAWAAWEWRKPVLTGTFAGIALLGGPSLWMGLLIFGFTYALTGGLVPAVETEADPNIPARSVQDEMKTAIAFGIGTLLIVGTLLFQSPNGLSAAVLSLSEFIRGWMHPSGVPATRLFLALSVYEPLPLLFALIALGRGLWLRWQLASLPEEAPPGLAARLKNSSALIFRLGTWALTALLLALFYPRREVADLAWMLVPLWALAALEISQHLDAVHYERVETLGTLALTLAILGFAWLDFASLNFVSYNSPDWQVRIYLLAGSLTLLLLSLLLIALGWSTGTARRGGLWGLLLMMVIYTSGAAWGTSGLRTPNGMELWLSETHIEQVALLTQTVNEVSEWSQQGIDVAIPVVVVGVDSPALDWALRQHPLEKVSTLDPTQSPEVVITPQMNDLSLPAAYRGQDFILRHSPVWSQLPAFDWVRWLTIRDYPQQSNVVMLWVRNDLFIDGPKQP